MTKKGDFPPITNQISLSRWEVVQLSFTLLSQEGEESKKGVHHGLVWVVKNAGGFFEG
jgi:hypothetical protein